MRVSHGYRSLIGMLLASLSALSLPFAPGPHVTVDGVPVKGSVVRPPAKKTPVPTHPAAPTQKMMAEQERLASAARSRQKFDIYRKRLYNRRTLAALTKEAARQARLQRLFRLA